MNNKEKKLHDAYDKIQANPNLTETEKALKQNKIITKIMNMNYDKLEIVA